MIEELLIWTRVDVQDAAFRGAELRAIGALESLSAARILAKGEFLSVVECDACGEDHAETVVWITEPLGAEPRAYISCPVAGRVRVAVDRVETWVVVLDALASFVARTLGMESPVRVLVENRLWLLGATSFGGISKDVFLLRGSSWEDSGSLLASDARLAAAVRPVILVPNRIPDDPAWRCSGRIILAISELSWFDGRSDVHRAITARVIAHEPNAAPIHEAQFRKDGQVWFLRFDGMSTQVKDIVGMGYIAELLRHPREPLEAIVLVTAARPTAHGAVETSEERVVPAGASMPGIQMTDRRAAKTVKHELAKRKAELESTPISEKAVRAALEHEISQLVEYLKQNVASRGRSRTAGGSAARARSSVTHAIDRALEQIAERHLSLADHLEKSIETGSSLMYRPKDLPDWQF